MVACHKPGSNIDMKGNKYDIVGNSTTNEQKYLQRSTQKSLKVNSRKEK